MEAQNHIAGQRRQQTVTDMPRAVEIGQALKDLRFPADKRRIQLFIQQQFHNNADYQKIVSLRPFPALSGPFCVQYICLRSTSTVIPTHHLVASWR